MNHDLEGYWDSQDLLATKARRHQAKNFRVLVPSWLKKVLPMGTTFPVVYEYYSIAQ